MGADKGAVSGQNERKDGYMNRLEDVINMKKLQELLGKKEEKKEISPLCWALAIGLVVVAAVAVIYALYRYFSPDYPEDFEEDFEDDFDDEFFDDEEEPAAEDTEDSQAESTEE